MLELTTDNAAEFLRDKGWIGPGPVHVELLAGGVSNVVFRVRTAERLFVLKQSRPQLRTKADWFSDLDRIYREQEVMEALYPLLPAGTVPQVLFSDRANYVFAMSHAPEDHCVLKELLLRREHDFDAGKQAGLILGRMHEATARDARFAERFRDQTVFIQLRVDPFYRRVLERHADLSPQIHTQIDRLLSVKEAICHGDFTPKNLLVHKDGLTLVDYETAHLGDPAMDIGLYLAHLLLKASALPHATELMFLMARMFWEGYTPEVTFRPASELMARGIGHLAVCLLARVDGTSPVDYLPEQRKKVTVRRLAHRLLIDQVSQWEEIKALFQAELAKTHDENWEVFHPSGITRMSAREVLDSRGNPTVEVEVRCRDCSLSGRAIAPSGASTGKHEAKELRDGDPQRHGGKGVRQAVRNIIEIIAPRLYRERVTEQQKIDRLLCEMDGTLDKSRLGANAILAVSLACAHAAAGSESALYSHLASVTAKDYQFPKPALPLPMVNLISGGLHAGGNLDFQDFLLLPIGAHSYSEALEMTVKVYRALGATLTRHGFEGVLVGDEGGYGPKLHSNEQAVQLILEAIEQAGYQPGKDAAIALDVASTHFYRDGRYYLKEQGGAALSSGQMIETLVRWVDRYPILSIEDGLAEDDWDGWKQLTAALGGKVQLIGDDFFVTNPERLRRGIAEGVANSVLVKLNQIGTLTETLEVVALAQQAGYRPVISARSGETEDTTIADLAVATGAGQIKIGSVARSERLAKYNQLLRIEEEMGPNAPFARWQDVQPRRQASG